MVAFQSTRCGKICGLRSGIGRIVCDTWAFAWTFAGLRGAPLHRQYPSAVQLSLSHPHASSLFPDTYNLLKALAKRTVIVRPRIGKVDGGRFRMLLGQVKRCPLCCSCINVAKVCFHSPYALSSSSSDSCTHANALGTAIVHDDLLTCFFFSTREALGPFISA